MTSRRRQLMMKRLVLVSGPLGMVGVWCGSALAQSAYPAKGQSPEQQQRDMAECQGWAMQQTGGPAAAPQPTATGQGVRGAARGAAVGAIGGAIGGDAGKGAAAGAAAGAGGGRAAPPGSPRRHGGQFSAERVVQQCHSGLSRGSRVHRAVEPTGGDSMRALLATGAVVGMALSPVAAVAAPLDGSVPFLCAINT